MEISNSPEQVAKDQTVELQTFLEDSQNAGKNEKFTKFKMFCENVLEEWLDDLQKSDLMLLLDHWTFNYARLDEEELFLIYVLHPAVRDVDIHGAGDNSLVHFFKTKNLQPASFKRGEKAVAEHGISINFGQSKANLYFIKSRTLDNCTHLPHPCKTTTCKFGKIMFFYCQPQFTSGFYLNIYEDLIPKVSYQSSKKFEVTFRAIKYWAMKNGVIGRRMSPVCPEVWLVIFRYIFQRDHMVYKNTAQLLREFFMYCHQLIWTDIFDIEDLVTKHITLKIPSKQLKKLLNLPINDDSNYPSEINSLKMFQKLTVEAYDICNDICEGKKNWDHLFRSHFKDKYDYSVEISIAQPYLSSIPQWLGNCIQGEIRRFIDEVLLKKYVNIAHLDPNLHGPGVRWIIGINTNNCDSSQYKRAFISIINKNQFIKKHFPRRIIFDLEVINSKTAAKDAYSMFPPDLETITHESADLPYSMSQPSQSALSPRIITSKIFNQKVQLITKKDTTGKKEINSKPPVNVVSPKELKNINITKSSDFQNTSKRNAGDSPLQFEHILTEKKHAQVDSWIESSQQKVLENAQTLSKRKNLLRTFEKTIPQLEQTSPTKQPVNNFQSEIDKFQVLKNTEIPIRSYNLRNLEKIAHIKSMQLEQISEKKQMSDSETKNTKGTDGMVTKPNDSQRCYKRSADTNTFHTSPLKKRKISLVEKPKEIIKQSAQSQKQNRPPKKIKYFKNTERVHKFPLEYVLSQKIEELDFEASYEQHGKLKDSCQNLLIHFIIHYELIRQKFKERSRNKDLPFRITLRPRDYVEAICERFPNENRDDYFVPVKKFDKFSKYVVYLIDKYYKLNKIKGGRDIDIFIAAPDYAKKN